MKIIKIKRKWKNEKIEKIIDKYNLSSDVVCCMLARKRKIEIIIL